MVWPVKIVFILPVVGAFGNPFVSVAELGAQARSEIGELSVIEILDVHFSRRAHA